MSNCIGVARSYRGAPRATSCDHTSMYIYFYETITFNKIDILY